MNAPGAARATLFVAIAACCFGAIPIFTLLATDAGASLQTALAARYALAAGALVLVVRGPRALAIPRRRATRLSLIGGIGQVAVTFTALTALRYAPAATVSFLFYTYPAWVTLIALLRRSEVLTGRRLLALLLALAGVFIMVGNPWSGELHPTGVALALAASVIYAFYIPQIAREQQGIDPAVASAWVCLASCLIYLAAGVVTGTLRVPSDALTGWGAIAGLALISTVAAFILFLRGLAVLGSVRTAIICTVEPFFTAFAAAIVLGQPLSSTTLAGGALIAVAVGLQASTTRG